MLSFVLSIFLLNPNALAREYINHSFNELGQIQNLSDYLSQIRPGDVVVVGERHGFHPHHLNQQMIIDEIGKSGLRVSFGIEHITYPNQENLNNYLNGSLDENEFLTLINWQISQYLTCFAYTATEGYNNPFSRQPFDCYRPLFWTSANYGGHSLALNLPRSITNKVYGGGLAALTPKDMALLPPDFVEGNQDYFERFNDTIRSGGDAHGPINDEDIKNMFTAQSLWDETMAWKSLEFMNIHPNGVLVIAVGDFHAAYGGGLPSRLRARGAQKVHVVSQDFVKNQTDAQLQELAKPDPKYGSRGDLTIITNVKK